VTRGLRSRGRRRVQKVVCRRATMPPEVGLPSVARAIDAKRADALARDFGDGAAAEIGVVLGTAFPPLSPVHGWQFDALERIARLGWRSRRSREFLVARLFRSIERLDDAEHVVREVRRFTWDARARIALRELLPQPLGGAPITHTARELSHLAEAGWELALSEASLAATRRLGAPLRADGKPSTIAVIGMGKLGGEELNAGSDVDVVLIYDTDDGAAGDASLHEYWTAVARRAVRTLEEPTEDGFVWRVDLRLRPEGSQGPLVYSWAAAERYYETWGRMWERVAWLRGRPIAGDLSLGAAFLREVIGPFVYRRPVDPAIATSLAEIMQRTRTEMKADARRDLKQGPGGIREAEFFVQALQLIWGGREPSLRVAGTLSALDRLRIKGLVTDRESRDISDAYVLLRQVEHAIQWRTFMQTHSLPAESGELETLARVVGFKYGSELTAALDRARAAVNERFSSLRTEALREPLRYTFLLSKLEQKSPELSEAVAEKFGEADISEHLVALARRPDGLLGSLTRERYPGLADRILEALRTSSDPEQAALYLRSFFGHFLSPDAYVTALGEEPRAVRRLVTVLGASAFIGDLITSRPDLADVALFGESLTYVDDAKQAVDQEVETWERLAAESSPAVGEGNEERREAFTASLGRAATRVTVGVGVADLAGELPNREVTRVLSALADRVLEHAVRYEMGGAPRGLAVIAVGKLGSGDIGYGSDLDVQFVYDPAVLHDSHDAPEHFSRLAQRIIRLVSGPHAAGYELDTRLRPSGSQGLLVTSVSAFARYHGVRLAGAPEDDDASRVSVLSSGAAWERQALLRARACAGDMELGERVIRIAHVAAYERGEPPALELHHLRMRMEKELAREREGRFDLKTGRGGLLDVEFATQWLQMRHGRDPRVRTTDTVGALHALRDLRVLTRETFEALRDGYVFLRRLDQRMRIVQGAGAAPVLDVASPGLEKLARLMFMRHDPSQTEEGALLVAYRDTTEVVRQAYLEVLGVPE
jgi:glutamate-ammonia-ligase adenylyltransferase